MSTQGAAEESPAGPEDAALIAFTKEVHRSDSAGGIFCVKLDGSGLSQLAGEAYYAAWSPDGRKIAYTQGHWRETEICVANADGSERQRIVAGEAGAWSPDGNQIVFVNRRDDGSSLMVVNIADGSTRQLTVFSRNRSDESPAWSPDGRIYFTRTPYGRHGNICSVNPDGSGLVIVRDRTDEPFSLSPDGRWLVCSRGAELLRVAVDGRGDEVTLVDNVGRLDPRAWPNASSWSPDGKQIVIGAHEAGYNNPGWLYRVNADGSGLSRVPNTGRGYDPSWQPHQPQ